MTVDPSTTTVADLQYMLALEFALASAKLIGLTKGVAPNPSVLLSTLSLKSPLKLMVIGTAAEVVKQLQEQDDMYAARRLVEEAEEQERLRVQAIRDQELAEQARIRREQLAADEARYRQQREEQQRAAALAHEERQRQARLPEQDENASFDCHLHAYSTAMATRCEQVLDLMLRLNANGVF